MNIERIIIANHNTIDFINPYDVLYCRSENKQTNIFLLNGRKVEIAKTLIILQREFPSILIRIDQCTIINKLHIQTIDKKSKTICLIDGTVMPFTMGLRDLLSRIKQQTIEESII